MTEEAIHAYPSKRFFVDMLTRDIRISDSILDLIDNSIDKAVARTGTNVMRQLAGEAPSEALRDYRVSVEFDGGFRLEDNCGGMAVEEARQHAFLLGSPSDTNTKGGLSVYGIGMKRAFFKLGNTIVFESQLMMLASS